MFHAEFLLQFNNITNRLQLAAVHPANRNLSIVIDGESRLVASFGEGDRAGVAIDDTVTFFYSLKMSMTREIVVTAPHRNVEVAVRQEKAAFGAEPW